MTGTTLGIAGIGLIGGSIGLRARTAGARVVGYDRSAAVTSRALQRGIIDASVPDLATLANACETLVVALPVDATETALTQLAEGTGGPSLIMDVASVKGPLGPFAARLASYIGTHPLAGRERGGVDAADGRLFERAIWAFVPHRDALLVERVRRFITAMGACPLQIDALRHDAIVALTSHLPQALSVALGAELAAGAAEPDVIELCGPGIQSMLRLARSPQTTWRPIVLANAGPIATRLRSIAQRIADAADGLERGDSEPLMSYFDAADCVAGALEERFSNRPRS